MSRQPSPAKDALLRRHGLQVAAQRVAVLRAFSERPHSADDIDKLIRAEIGASSGQAVYDALATVTDKRLPRRIQSGSGPMPQSQRLLTRPPADGGHATRDTAGAAPPWVRGSAVKEQ